MKKLLFLILLLFTVNITFSQITTNVSLKCQIYASSGTAPTFNVQSLVSDELSKYDGSSVAAGDKLFIIDGSECYELHISSITLGSGSVLNFVAYDSTGVLTTIPNGQAAVIRKYSIQQVPFIPAGLRSDLASCILQKIASTVNSVTGGSGIDSSAIKINNVANVRAYGALGDGSDATTAFQSAIATGLAVYVPPGRYLISSALTLTEGQQIFGNGDDCIVQVAANISVFRLTRRNSVSSFRIVGDLGWADTDQYGIFMDGGASYDTTHENSIKAMSFDSLGGAGIYITRTVDEYQGNLISGCTFRKCLIGVNMDTRGEYTQLSSSQFVANTTAIRVKGGNANISDCIITSNTTGISILSGDNSDHGQATGCTINHNTTGISINGISYGFHFINSQMWSNTTQVNFISASNVHFTGGAMESGTISATSATNCYFTNMQFVGTVTKSLASQAVYFVNNIDGSSVGKYPTSAGDYVLRFTSPNVYEYVAAGGGGGTVSPMRIFSQHFDTVTANTVTVTVNGGTLPTNADALLVFWNGQLITADYYTVTGSDIEFDFDVTENVTVKFFIQ